MRTTRITVLVENAGVSGTDWFRCQASACIESEDRPTHDALKRTVCKLTNQVNQSLRREWNHAKKWHAPTP